MRASGWAVIGLVLVAPLLAGCADEGRNAAITKAIAEPLAGSPRGTLLRILVISDEYLPIAGAHVNIVGLGVNGTTDEFGDAFFQVARPGRYAVHVHRSGYYPNSTRVEVSAEAPMVARIRLTDAPRDGHFTDYYYYQATCAPTVYVQGVTPNGRCQETAYFPSAYARWILGRGLVKAHVALEWPSQAGGTEAMRLEIRFPDAGPFADGREALVAEGARPVAIQIPSDILTDRMRGENNVVEIIVGLPQSGPAALNGVQPFHIEATFDYFVEAPDVDPAA